MSRFVLVHGAWHGAWCWRDLVPVLEARGHQVLSIDLPSHGDDPAAPTDVGWSEYTARTVGAVRDSGAGTVLVGHSMGGAVISRTAPEVEDALAALVFLAAFLVRPGAAAPELGRTELSAGIRPAPDGTVHLDPAVVRDAFYHDCSGEQVAFARERLVPNPAAVLDIASADAPWTERVPRYYIACTEDRAIPIATQREMIAQGDCAAVYTLEASHSPFFSQPDALAALLERAARDAGA